MEEQLPTAQPVSNSPTPQPITSPPVESPTETPPPINQEQQPKKWIWIVVGIVILLLTATVSFLAYQNLQLKKTQPTPTPSPSASTDPTANWETYTNDSLGFKIQYPPTVEIDKEYDDDYNRSTSFKSEDLSFSVMIRKNTNNTNLDSYYYMDGPITKTTTLAGLPANIYEMPAGYQTHEGRLEPSITIVTEKNSEFFHIRFSGDALLSDDETKILSTFEFTQN